MNAQKLDNDFKNAVQDLEEMRTKRNQLEAQRTFEKQSNDVKKVKENVDQLGDSLSKSFKKAGKLAIGIFSIRSAYIAVRQASSILQQYDQQYADNIEYIRFALATSIQPILEAIVQLAYKALQFVQMIVYIFTGKDIFANASTDKFNNSLKNANKSAKELQKTIAGFDEMNILGNNTKGSGSSAKTPFIDLSLTLPDWLKGDSFWERAVNAANHFFGSLWENVRKTEKELENRLVNTRFYTDAYHQWDVLMKGVDRMHLGTLQVADGTFTTIGGLIETLVGVFTGNQNLITDGWKNFCNGLGKTFEGLCNLIGGLGEALWGTIQGLVITAGNWLDQQWFTPMKNWWSNLWTAITTGSETAWAEVRKPFEGAAQFFAGIYNNIKSGFENIVWAVTDWMKGVVQNVANGFLSQAEMFLNGAIDLANGFRSFINNIPGVNIATLPRVRLPRVYLATGGIVNMPNKGVNIGGAIAGESGREGVIPLTDSQAMETLGEAIGRYITINANIVNKMNGRVISKELQQIKNDSDFAYNR
jgi:hypothetical protein